MKNLLCLACCLFIFQGLQAHPSYGIVITDEGNIIFCDVLHNQGTVWKLDPKGNLSTVLTGEHCHFIFLDHEGQIWGTDHDYIEARETNRNTLWKLVDEKKEVVIPPTEDPTVFSGVNFVVGRSGKIYFNANRKLYVRSPNGFTELFSPHEFGRITSLQLSRDGQIIVADNNVQNGALIKVSATGDLTYVATDLIDASPPNPPFEEPRFNLLYASFENENGNIYVANSGSRRITQVDQSGKKTHIFHSEPPWYPVAYTEKDGIGYVMEMSFVSGVGNLGPQIQRLVNGKKEVLVNVDAPKVERGQMNPPETESHSIFQSNWIWLLMILPIMMIGIATFRARYHRR